MGCYIRQDASQSYREVLLFSIGAFYGLQECSSFTPAPFKWNILFERIRNHINGTLPLTLHSYGKNFDICARKYYPYDDEKEISWHFRYVKDTPVNYVDYLKTEKQQRYSVPAAMCASIIEDGFTEYAIKNFSFDLSCFRNGRNDSKDSSSLQGFFNTIYTQSIVLEKVASIKDGEIVMGNTVDGNEQSHKLDLLSFFVLMIARKNKKKDINDNYARKICSRIQETIKFYLEQEEYAVPASSCFCRSLRNIKETNTISADINTINEILIDLPEPTDQDLEDYPIYAFASNENAAEYTDIVYKILKIHEDKEDKHES